MRELKYRIAQSKVKQLVNGKVRFKTRQSASILLCYPDTNGQLSHYIIFNSPLITIGVLNHTLIFISLLPKKMDVLEIKGI